MRLLIFFLLWAPAILISQDLNTIDLQVDSLMTIKGAYEKKIVGVQQSIDSLNEIKTGLMNQHHQGENYVCIMGTLLYAEPGGHEDYGKVVKGDIVNVLETIAHGKRGIYYYKVIFNGQIGFIIADALTTEAIYNASINREAEHKKRLIESEAEHRKSLIEEYGEVTANKILRHTYWIGMTKDMAIKSLGSPDDINRTVTAGGINEQWVYRKRGIYLYFDDGVLTTFQD